MKNILMGLALAGCLISLPACSSACKRAEEKVAPMAPETAKPVEMPSEARPAEAPQAYPGK